MMLQLHRVTHSHVQCTVTECGLTQASSQKETTQSRETRGVWGEKTANTSGTNMSAKPNRATHIDRPSLTMQM